MDYDAVDTYAFGMTMLELLTHQPPWAREAATTKEIYNHVHNGRRPVDFYDAQFRMDLEQEAPEGWMDLMKACWEQKPQDRPKFCCSQTSANSCQCNEGAIPTVLDRLVQIRDTLEPPHHAGSPAVPPGETMRERMREGFGDVRRRFSDYTALSFYDGVRRSVSTFEQFPKLAQAPLLLRSSSAGAVGSPKPSVHPHLVPGRRSPIDYMSRPRTPQEEGVTAPKPVTGHALLT
jgi:hypothetical protein